MAILAFLSTSVSAQTHGWSQLSGTCRRDLFPISIGGSGDEHINCVVHDEKNNQIIVAGNSTSANFVWASRVNAFAVAFDLDGNWKWGKYFWESSKEVKSISACHMSKDGSLVALGVGSVNDRVILEINPQNGAKKNYFNIVGSIKTLDAFYLDSDRNEFFVGVVVD